MKVSENFHDWEFSCGCQCGQNKIGAAVVYIVQRVRTYYDRPVTITSAVRCLTYNSSPAVGSNNKSQHPRKTAIDFVVEGIDPHQICDLLEEWYPDSLGIGRYDDFTHVDTRLGMARWEG